MLAIPGVSRISAFAATAAASPAIHLRIEPAIAPSLKIMLYSDLSSKRVASAYRNHPVASSAPVVTIAAPTFSVPIPEMSEGQSPGSANAGSRPEWLCRK